MSSLTSTPIAPKSQDDVPSDPVAEVSTTELAPIGEADAEKDSASAVGVCVQESFENPAPDIAVRESPSEPPPAEIQKASATSPEDTLKLDDIEPTVDTKQGLESFTDELGFETSKTYQKMSGKEPEMESHAAPDGELGRPEHKRSDSVMRVEVADMTQLEEDLAELENVSAPVVVNSASDAISTPKKSKKSKKKKSSSIVF